jgi:hypothetical protein
MASRRAGPDALLNAPAKGTIEVLQSADNWLHALPLKGRKPRSRARGEGKETETWLGMLSSSQSPL